jgi:signal peptidase II
LLGLALDLGSKEWAFRRVAATPVVIDRLEVLRTSQPADQIPLHNPVVVVPSVLEFTLVANRGAVFGLGAGQRAFFIAFTMIALALGVWLFCVWTRPREYVAHVAIGLLLAGGLGNLYDRAMYACVRDFIHPLPRVRLPFGWSWPWGGNEIWPYVSNVADLFLIIGIGILVIRALRDPASKKPVKATEPPTGA